MTIMRTFGVSRRNLIKAGLAMAVAPGVGSAAVAVTEQQGRVSREGRIRQSVCRWCYQAVPLDDLCAFSAKIGLKGIDLLQPEEWGAPRKHGLICTMGYAGGGDIPNALNRLENHAAIEAAFRRNIPLAAKMGVPNVITFSGNRRGMSDEEGAKNTVIGLNRVKKIAEDKGYDVVMEIHTLPYFKPTEDITKDAAAAYDAAYPVAKPAAPAPEKTGGDE